MHFSYMGDSVKDTHIIGLPQRAQKNSPAKPQVFTAPTIKGRPGVNAMKAKKHLYDHIVYDSLGNEISPRNLIQTQV